MRPTMRPGIWRTYSLRQVNRPRYGPPKFTRPAQALPLRRPRCPRRTRRAAPACPSEIGSAATMYSAPAACAASPSACTSSGRRGTPAAARRGRRARPSAARRRSTSTASSGPKAYVRTTSSQCRVHARVHGDAVAAGDAAGHQAGLGQRAGAVVHAGVGHVHAHQLAGHRLQLEHRLQRALADLRLVRRVGGVVLAAADDVRDRARDEVPVRAAAEEATPSRSRRRRFWCARSDSSRERSSSLERRRQVEAIDAELRRDVGEQLVRRSPRRSRRASCGGLRRCSGCRGAGSMPSVAAVCRNSSYSSADISSSSSPGFERRTFSIQPSSYGTSFTHCGLSFSAVVALDHLAGDRREQLARPPSRTRSRRTSASATTLAPGSGSSTKTMSPSWSCA